MAKELQFIGNTTHVGLTVIAKIYDIDGSQVGIDVSCPEVGSTGIYIGNMPTAILGGYSVRFYSDSLVIAFGTILWDGTKEVTSLTITEDIALLNAGVDSIEANISTINGNINTIQLGITSIDSDITVISTDIVSINNNIITVSGNVATIQGDIVDVKSVLIDIEVDVATLDAKIVSINTSVDSIDIKIDGVVIDVANVDFIKNVLEGDIIPTENIFSILHKDSKAILVQKDANEINGLIQLSEDVV
jgi:hypothetical protein